MRRNVLLLLLPLLLIGLPGCGKKAEPSVTFSFPAGGEPASCDPQLLQSLMELHIIENAYEGLYAPGPEGAANVVPGVATRFDKSNDGRTYTFHLRPEAKWSDGSPLTAHDFEWSWKRLIDEGVGEGEDKLGAQYSFLYDEAQIQSAVATGNHTFVVTLKSPNGMFENILTFPVFAPVQQKAVTSAEASSDEPWCAVNPVSNGPFVVTEHVLGDHITMVKNPHYWDAANVAVDTLHISTVEDEELLYRLFAAGQFDWLGLEAGVPPAQLDLMRGADGSITNPKIEIYPTLTTTYLNLNTTRGPLVDVRVREALSLAIDRDKLMRNTIRRDDVTTTSFYPPGLGSYDALKISPQHDCEGAQALMTEAGFPSGEGFGELEYIYRTGSIGDKVALAITGDWEECLGVTVTTRGMEFRAWLGHMNTSATHVDITENRWQADYAHPHTFAGLMLSDGPNNYSSFRNDRYDELLARGVKTGDATEIQELYGAAERILLDEMPVIPLYFSSHVGGLDRERWTGLNHNSSMRNPLRYVRPR